MVKLIYILLALTSASHATITADASASISVTVASPADVAQAYGTLLGERNCNGIPPESLHGAPRGSIELLILCVALTATSNQSDVALKVIPFPNYARSLRTVETGGADVSAESIWLEDISSANLLYSDPLIRSMEFEKGLYVTSKALLDRHPINADYIQSLRGITVKNWAYDWNLLNQITPHTVSATRYSAIYQMMLRERADFTLLRFVNTKDMTQTMEGTPMYPIPGIKVRFSGSRHYVISRQSPHAEVLQFHINQGLKRLRESGQLHAYLQAMGLGLEQTQDWLSLPQ